MFFGTLHLFQLSLPSSPSPTPSSSSLTSDPFLLEPWIFFSYHRHQHHHHNLCHNSSKATFCQNVGCSSAIIAINITIIICHNSPRATFCQNVGSSSAIIAIIITIIIVITHLRPLFVRTLDLLQLSSPSSSPSSLSSLTSDPFLSEHWMFSCHRHHHHHHHCHPSPQTSPCRNVGSSSAIIAIIIIVIPHLRPLLVGTLDLLQLSSPSSSLSSLTSDPFLSERWIFFSYHRHHHHCHHSPQTPSCRNVGSSSVIIAIITTIIIKIIICIFLCESCSIALNRCKDKNTKQMHIRHSKR